MPRRNLNALFFIVLGCLLCHQRARQNPYARYLSEVFQAIQARALQPVEPALLYEAGLSGMLGTLDEYSGYIGRAEIARFQEDLEQEFAGIGVQIRMEELPGTGTHELVVVTPIVGTPAHAAGIHAGDAILAIDGRSVVGIDVETAVGWMRGPPGKEVLLRIRRADSGLEEEVRVVRASIKVPSVLGDSRTEGGGWSFVLEDHPRIGYIRILQFGAQTDAELRDVLSSMEEQSLQGLVLDLRGNAGGLLSAAVRTCDLFLDEGTIVTTRGREGKVLEAYHARRGTILQGVPLVVLVDKYSASASEIVAACLQDHDRAIIVGERTWGKGTVQTVMDIEDGRAALRLTTAAYWRPSGVNIHRSEGLRDQDPWGVQPATPKDLIQLDEDERLRVLRERQRRDVVGPAPSGTADRADDVPFVDRQLERALAVLTGPDSL